MIASLALSLALTTAGGLWPFGGPAQDVDATVSSLKRRIPDAELRRDLRGTGTEARDHYREFLELPGAPSDMRAESMRRLADLYLAAGEDGQFAGDSAGGERDYRQAIVLYERYLAEFPGRDGADRVLYSLSRAHEALGDTARAHEILENLIKVHPQSAVAAEAQFRIGENLFMAKDYAAAERAFDAVVAAGEHSEFYEQALYKQGWSLFKQSLYEECLDSFLAVLTRRLAAVSAGDSQRPLDLLSRPERELSEDSLRAVSLAISQLDGMASLDALMDRNPVAFADVVYAGLGDLYLAQERYGDAADAYRRFVMREPLHPRAPYLQAEVIRAWAAGKFPTRVLEAKAQFVTLYGLDTAYWQGTEPASRPIVVGYLKTSLADLASHDHERAQKTRAADAYQQAALWYRRYLQYFPDDPESAQRNFLLAEILYEAGEFEAAAQEYQRTAYEYGAHAQAAEAGYGGLLAAREHGKNLADEQQLTWQAGYIEQRLRFVASFPDHPQAVTVQTGVAEDLFSRGDLERAVQVAGEVVVRTPPAAPELERVAWKVLAHSEFDLGRYAQAEKAYLRLRDLGDADPKQRAEIEERIAASVYRQAEAQRAAGNTNGAVAEFLRVAEAAPAASIGATAVYDAAGMLAADKQWPRTVEVLQQFRREFPGHALNADVTRGLAVALEESGRGAEAAREFEAIAGSGDAGEEIQREALWRAAQLYRGAGQSTEERRITETIVQRFPAPFAEAMEARLRLAELARDTADDRARRHWLQEIVTADRNAGASRNDRSRYLAAHASLELAAPLRDAFVASRLTAPLPQSMKTKKQRMELALEAYGQAAQYAVADVVTAATFETAELYARLGRDLLESEKPAKLDAEALEEYQLLLEEQAFPFEEKAIELHGLNAARAAEGTYDEWVRRSFTRLAELSPARYARSERSERYVADID